jgi:hypothetical protein
MLLRERSAFRPSGFIEPCRPTKAPRPPSGPLWIHEIKHDGYRLIVVRDGRLPRRPLARLDQGEEPKSSRVGQGQGGILMKSAL